VLDLAAYLTPTRVTSLPDLKAQILSLTRDYARQAPASHRPASDPARPPWAEGSPALTSPKLPETRRIRAGDEVITVAAGFPTTAAPIVQVGTVPMFIDADDGWTGTWGDISTQSFYPPHHLEIIHCCELKGIRLSLI
jgi:hypothetical protein